MKRGEPGVTYVVEYYRRGRGAYRGFWYQWREYKDIVKAGDEMARMIVFGKENPKHVNGHKLWRIVEETRVLVEKGR